MSIEELLIIGALLPIFNLIYFKIDEWYWTSYVAKKVKSFEDEEGSYIVQAQGFDLCFFTMSDWKEFIINNQKSYDKMLKQKEEESE